MRSPSTAATLRRDGRAADADRANGLAVARTGLIDDFLTPGLGTVVVLTEREREVGELASKRRRNREIADHLGISIRTVDNHLASLYRKLGIDRRDELSTWFENAENGQGVHRGERFSRFPLIRGSDAGTVGTWQRYSTSDWKRTICKAPRWRSCRATQVASSGSLQRWIVTRSSRLIASSRRISITSPG